MALEILNPSAPLESKFSAAVERIFQVLNQQPSSTPLVVALCGGRSVVGILQALLSESTNQPPELLKRIHFFMVDERITPLTHPDSNFGGLAKQLFDSLVEQGKITRDQLHPLYISAHDADSACADYTRELKAFGGVFNVVVLGMGEDGHVAGLFPNHSALSFSGAGFIPFFDSPKPPAARVTASRDLVTGAQLGVLLALGEGKRAAWNDFNNSAIPVERCPAKLVAAMPQCVVVSDLL